MPNPIDEQLKLILDKKFNKSIHAGYDPEDVDAFFDEVSQFIIKIRDAAQDLKSNEKQLQERIKQLGNQIEILNKGNLALTQENETLRKDGYGAQRTIQNDDEVIKRNSELKK
ncbi:MAG: DivIVA domain-containing protein [Mycoplasmataceae bacterium]|jgi:DivIVA domain-containing protein|nr:DivIVA domain-containing protein [Mycoplasmataceae bacterium]